MSIFQISPLIVCLFFCIHGSLVWILYKLIKPKIDDEKQGLFIWLTCFSLFLPVIGELFGVAIWYAAVRLSKQPVDDVNDQYVFKVKNFEKLAQEVASDSDIMPISTIMNTINPKKQKEWILNIQKINVRDKAKYLQAALQSEDTEIVHYAATMMNALAEGYKREIDAKKKELASVDVARYKEVSSLYQQYIESGLINSHIKTAILHEYESILKKAVVYFPDEEEFHVQWTNLLYMLGEVEKAYQISLKMIERFPSCYEGYVLAIKILYEKQQWKEMKRLLDKMNGNVLTENMPFHVNRILKTLDGIVV